MLMIFAGWVNRHQLIVIEFLQAKNRMLKERLRGRRIRFPADDGIVYRRQRLGGMLNFYYRETA